MVQMQPTTVHGRLVVVLSYLVTPHPVRFPVLFYHHACQFYHLIAIPPCHRQTYRLPKASHAYDHLWQTEVRM
jgi:hypothetical protein